MKKCLAVAAFLAVCATLTILDSRPVFAQESGRCARGRHEVNVDLTDEAIGRASPGQPAYPPVRKTHIDGGDYTSLGNANTRNGEEVRPYVILCRSPQSKPEWLLPVSLGLLAVIGGAVFYLHLHRKPKLPKPPPRRLTVSKG